MTFIRMDHVFMIALFCTIICIFGCVEPFMPMIDGDENNILVVDGFIKAGNGKSTFRLSRASPLDDQPIRPMRGAVVIIVSSAGEHFSLHEISDGVYESDELQLPLNLEYKLTILLSDGVEYISQPQWVKVTPPIDSLHWKWTSTLDIFVNTHDTEGKSRYYLWSYEETWQIHSPFMSFYKWNGDTIVLRSDDERREMLDCWRTFYSSDLKIHTTSQLMEDAAAYKIRWLPHASEKTETRYSILVKQHTLTPEHFNYLSLIQKNSTQVGSFFDPLPSEIRGNIVNPVNPEEIVVGYVGVYTEESKRMFIDNRDLPPTPTQYQCLDTTGLFVKSIHEIDALLNLRWWTPIGITTDPSTGVTAVSVRETYCLDCRLRGSSVKPQFWE